MCVFIYTYIIYTVHTYIMWTKTFILDAINRLTALNIERERERERDRFPSEITSKFQLQRKVINTELYITFYSSIFL